MKIITLCSVKGCKKFHITRTSFRGDSEYRTPPAPCFDCAEDIERAERAEAFATQETKRKNK